MKVNTKIKPTKQNKKDKDTSALCQSFKQKPNKSKKNYTEKHLNRHWTHLA